MRRRNGCCQSSRRRAAVAVQAALAMVAVAGFTALTVDVGRMYSAKSDLQRAADAAALAGASSYLSDAGLTQNTAILSSVITSRSQNYSVSNPTLYQSTQLELADLRYGRHHFDSPGEPLSSGERWNAVQVTLRRTSGGVNGPVPLFFAKVFGYREADVTAWARAAVDDRVAGYRIIRDGDFIPFTIHEAIYEDRYANGPDDYAYNESVYNGSDGVREIRLYPWKWSSEDSTLDTLNWPQADNQSDAAGNFGTLNVGIDNQGSVGLEDQIVNGISASDLQDEFDTSELVFDDAAGSHTYTSTGNPGLSTTLRLPSSSASATWSASSSTTPRSTRDQTPNFTSPASASPASWKFA